MSTESPTPFARCTRRDLLWAGARAGAGLSLAAALAEAGLADARPGEGPLAPRAGHFPAKAKHCIFLFMFGGPSQMDLFDCKPGLNSRDGRSIELEFRKHDVRVQTLLGSKRAFARHGQTGQWVSDVLPETAKHVDKLAIVKSLYVDSFAHGSALIQMNTGQLQQGHPALGAWLGLGRGSENGSLPGFVVMHDPRGGPISGPANWSSGYMDAAYQGTLFRAAGDPVQHLAPPASCDRYFATRDMRADQIETLAELNALHAAARGGHADLAARTAAFDLAHAMEIEAREALDLAQEDEATRAMYCIDEKKGEHPLSVGPAPFGRQCLIARRLIERGVRFVQIYHGGGHQQQTWDAHHGVEVNLGIHCPEIDRPVAALLADLERTGLLQETLVLWGGEFGRMPTSQQSGANQVANPGGRDHNPKALCMWLAGAGVRPGSYGETDEIGAEAVVDRHHVRDLHATVLRLMGLDHTRLTYRYGGLDRKLTGVIEAQPIEAILA
jgi:hypothetical protein